jgi:hypothetical protein
MPASVFSNREGTPPSSSHASTTSGYSSVLEVQALKEIAKGEF